MITSKKEMKEWITYEKNIYISAGAKKGKLYGFVRSRGGIEHYAKLLRKTEYYINCRHDPIGKIFAQLYQVRLKSSGVKLGLTIPPNVFGRGLRIAHYGSVTVHPNCRIGEDCLLFNNTVLGKLGVGYKPGVPTLGDHVFIGSNSCILGPVHVGNHVTIAAGSVVLHDVPDNVTVAGAPAKVIKNSGWEGYEAIKAKRQ